MAGHDRAEPGRHRGAAEYGCAFILDHPSTHWAGLTFCDRPRRPGSDYCPEHHVLCHLRRGSRAEIMKDFAQEALADAVGGKQARRLRAPPAHWFPRVEKAARPFFCHKRSRYVQEQAMTQQAKTEQSKRKLIRPSDMESADETAPSAERRGRARWNGPSGRSRMRPGARQGPIARSTP